MTIKELWKIKKTITADKNLDLILSSTISLPLKYWRTRFFFFGMRDNDIFLFSHGKFPVKLVPHKTHPIFTLKPLPDKSGFTVCPCSTKHPFNKKPYKYIKSGCRLIYTNNYMDKKSYITQKIKFIIPRNLALRLKFYGEVPAGCIKKEY